MSRSSWKRSSIGKLPLVITLEVHPTECREEFKLAKEGRCVGKKLTCCHLKNKSTIQNPYKERKIAVPKQNRAKAEKRKNAAKETRFHR